MPKLTAVALLVGLTAAACGGAADLGAPGGPSPSTPADGPDARAMTPVTVAQIEADPPDGGLSALDNPFDRSLPEPLLDPLDLRAGGPPPDGIPPIDRPTFLPTHAVDHVDDNEPVLVLRVDDEVRIYPVQIMVWHEIVNDTVGGIPVAVTYCPLCNSAIAYDRRVGQRVMSFGTSGMLYNSALVMYDRQTESLWSHFTGQAVIGRLTGTMADVLAVATVSWADAIADSPDALVLSRDTGFDRSYGRNPYPGYDDVGTSPILFEGEVDGRLAAKTRVVGLRTDDDAVAVITDELRAAGVLQVDLSGTPITVWSEPGTASALDASTVAGGRDVGATGAFVATVDGRAAMFIQTEAGFVDDVSGTTWNILGRATAGQHRGAQLEPVVHVDTFWFAWAAFLPASRVVP